MSQGPNNQGGDKYEVLREENIDLKSKHQHLEEKVKLIATKLKRQIGQLK